MIPTFPNFKKIDIKDRKSIEFYTHKYEPFSDFNFISLWSWDTNGERMISQLNGNLVVRFTDYDTCEPFLSFLGVNETELTVRKLINFAKTSNISPVLRFVSETSIKDLKDLIIKEDRDNFDYVFSVADFVELSGVKFKTKRHSVARFLRENPDATFKIKELNDPLISQNIFTLLNRWSDNKKTDKKIVGFTQEETAISKLLQSVDHHNLKVSCVFLHNELIGFSIDEILPFKYAVSHFFKVDINYNGVSDFLNKEIAKYLSIQGVKFWNWEQDLGIVNLKKSKTSHHPINFLKKYNVSLT